MSTAELRALALRQIEEAEQALRALLAGIDEDDMAGAPAELAIEYLHEAQAALRWCPRGSARETLERLTQRR